MDDDALPLDRFRAVFSELERESGFARIRPQWGITETVLRRGAAPPERRLRGADTDSRADAFRRPDGAVLWSVEINGPDDVDGVPWFTERFLLAPAAVIAEAEAIESWLTANADAYELFAPIRWSAAPERARAAKTWMDTHRARLSASPLAPLFDDLERELRAAIDGDRAF